VWSPTPRPGRGTSEPIDAFARTPVGPETAPDQPGRLAAPRDPVEASPDDGQPLRRYRVAWERELVGYVADPAACTACPAKAACTPGTTGRHVHRSLHEAYLDRVRASHATESYKRAMRKRAVWIEPLFGEAKQWHGLRRFRFRGLTKVTTQTLLCAAGQNLKRWLIATGWGRRHAPCGALAVPHGAQCPSHRQATRGPHPCLRREPRARRLNIHRGVRGVRQRAERWPFNCVPLCGRQGWHRPAAGGQDGGGRATPPCPASLEGAR
jgi:Transposase DDE domain